MRAPEFYPHPVDAVAFRETHISWVFLTGTFAYKVKKPVDLGFLDFTTLGKREHYCRRELELNRRLTDDIYLDVLPVTGGESGFQLDGSGPTVDYVVKMRQLSASDSLENLLAGNKLHSSDIDRLAETLARFYAKAASGLEIDEFGTHDSIATNCDENFRQIAETDVDFIDRRRLRIVESAARGFLEHHEKLLEKRIANGRIRDCHGDLRTDHVYFTAKGIQIIDCIEFNNRFRYSDVACDLAFLAMELDFQKHPQTAGRLVSAFVRHSGDRRLHSLLDFYKCYRAMVRVKVNCLRFTQADVGKDEGVKLAGDARRYLALAYRYAVQFSRPTLWVVCGQVATGKSTVACALADSLSISVLRSDVLRKQLFKRSKLKNGVVHFGEGIYSKEATSLTYGRLLLEAQAKIESGRSVVLDATFSRKAQRREALRLAGEAGAFAIFVECHCSKATIRKRLQERTESGPVSDARLQHLEKLEASFEKLDDLAGECRIRVDTERGLSSNLQRILAFTADPKSCRPELRRASFG
jgi:aminoglycoside phosphotransferase family enzyme/predicted kinase